jgi:hypothetical protein
MQFHRIAIAVGSAAYLLAAAPVAAADPPPDADEMATYPVAQGSYTTSSDFCWVYFKTPDGRSCGIGPNGGPVGCDAVPLDAPAQTNQTIVNSWGPAVYRGSNTATFTRDVDVLPEGYRLENWGASCGVGHQGTVTCTTYGAHGFTISAVYGALW